MRRHLDAPIVAAPFPSGVALVPFTLEDGKGEP